MEELDARAMLVLARDVGDGVTASVSRSEIEEVLRSDEAPIQLVLDITRFADGEAAESRRLAVSWTRADLERLLEEATEEQVTLTFDRDTLAKAVATDVEAHGIRETALAIAVAATAATGVAANAAADPGGPPFLTSGAPIAQNLAPDDRAVPRATPVSAPAPDLAPDDRAVPRATPVSPATPVSVSTPDLAPDDRGVPRPTPVATSDPTGVSDPGISWSPPPAETALVAAAIALAITGAFFLVGGRRIRPRPS